MGGDSLFEDITELSSQIKERYNKIKTAWYSGKNSFPNLQPNNPLNYIKIGEYQEDKGGLKQTQNKPKTLQNRKRTKTRYNLYVLECPKVSYTEKSLHIYKLNE